MTRDQKANLMKFLRKLQCEDLACAAIAYTKNNDTAVVVAGEETAAALVANTIYTSLAPQPGETIH